MEPDAARSAVETRFRAVVEDTAGFHSAQFLVHSGSRGVHWKMAAGGNGQHPAEPDQPFYAASVGKTFTATIVAMLVEEGDLRFDDPIAPSRRSTSGTDGSTSSGTGRSAGGTRADRR